MNKDEIYANEYMKAIRELVEEGRRMSLVVSGHSMTPLLVSGRDRIWFEKPKRKMKKGDMVFYNRTDGQFVMHRICKVKPEGFYIVGDAQSEIEGPVLPEQIFAIVTEAERKGKRIGPGDFWWEFFEHVWIHIIPFRTLIKKIYCLWGKKSFSRNSK